VPNYAAVFGYLNAAWTLKADLIAGFVCRILNYMDRKGYAECRPTLADPAMAPAPWFDFSSGYLQRALDRLPKLGPEPPWVAYQNYFKDVRLFRGGALEDGVLKFRAVDIETSASDPAAGRTAPIMGAERVAEGVA
jgi:hypothetical protein